MTGRELHEEWVGKLPTSKPPWRVVERLLEAAGNRCQGPCHQEIGAGNAFDVDHVIALKDWLGEGHGNRETNLQLLCRRICHKHKSRIEQIARAHASRTRRALLGHKRQSRNPVPGSKASGWARRYDRETGRFLWVRR